MKDDEFLMGRLGESESSGALDGLEIEYWTGGGLPPPRYVSHQFRLLQKNEGDTLRFARPRFDAAFQPHLIDARELPASPDDVRTLARLVRESGIFDGRFPEEQEPATSHVIKT